ASLAGFGECQEKFRAQRGPIVNCADLDLSKATQRARQALRLECFESGEQAVFRIRELQKLQPLLVSAKQACEVPRTIPTRFREGLGHLSQCTRRNHSLLELEYQLQHGTSESRLVHEGPQRPRWQMLGTGPTEEPAGQRRTRSAHVGSATFQKLSEAAVRGAVYEAVVPVCRAHHGLFNPGRVRKHPQFRAERHGGSLEIPPTCSFLRVWCSCQRMKPPKLSRLLRRGKFPKV